MGVEMVWVVGLGVDMERVWVYGVVLTDIDVGKNRRRRKRRMITSKYVDLHSKELSELKPAPTRTSPDIGGRTM